MADNEERVPMSVEERAKLIRQRNVALAFVLVGLVALFFIVTVARLGGNVAKRPIVGSLPIGDSITAEEVFTAGLAGSVKRLG